MGGLKDYKDMHHVDAFFTATTHKHWRMSSEMYVFKQHNVVF